MPRRVTLADVSRAAGVGMATVSRAMGDHPDVSEATRERVRAIASELGYRPSVAARALRTGGFHAISAIVPDAGWGWWEPVIRAAHATANERGYQLLVHPADSEGGLAATVDGLASIPTEGVIVISVPDQDAVREACNRIPLPAVAIDDTSRATRFPTVSADNRAGARTVVEHLIAQGRRSIALVRGRLDPEHSVWGDGLFLEERTLGYREALEAAGLAVDERLIIDFADPFDESRTTFPEIDRLLADGPPIDAVFCAADLMAAPVLRSLRAAGIPVPTAVAVAGFDDERAALLVDPQLTTVRQPYEQLGRTAVEMLLATIAGDAVPERRTEIPGTLVVRASTS
ncbi:MAG: LacI family DNA-binding transcriptional regulator [Microbacterium sp.]|nr:LacI family DNA-binding transcriptional regulator [Microbacterium sp.]